MKKIETCIACGQVRPQLFDGMRSKRVPAGSKDLECKSALEGETALAQTKRAGKVGPQ